MSKQVAWERPGSRIGPYAAAAVLMAAAAGGAAAGTMWWFGRHGWPEAFAENLLFQVYGAVLNGFVLVGAGAVWVRLRRKGRAVRRHREIIEDFRDWNSAEAAHRIAGSLRRLNRWGVSRIELSRCTLRNMHLREAKLSGSRLVQARLAGANLSRADLQDADLNGADLRGAFLWHSRLGGAILNFADLRGANLENADCRKTLLQGARLDGARLVGVDLTGAQGLEPEQLASAVGWKDAKLDPDLARRMGTVG